MHVHRSNRVEALVDVLAEVVRRPLADPLAPECIVVQGRGMERWLSMQLAERLGVWANPDFPFPRHLILRLLSAVLGTDETADSPFQPETLLWSIADLLPRHLDETAFAPISTYLAGDERGMRRIQLAERIAATFDQYVVFRPEMLLAWEGGTDTHWQATLWRDLVARHGARHIAAAARAALRALQRGTVSRRDCLSQRICLFGLSTLPPLYLQLLAALAPITELHLFLLSPSPEYWADVRSRREVLRRLIRSGAGAADVDEVLQREAGNPLLASLGHVGGDFQSVLEASVDYRDDDRDLYVDPGTASMLATLQSDIASLTHRGPNGTAPALPLSGDDESIAVHACHGPMREVEVLHDQLLALFEQDHTLEPRDVLVMSPAIDTYAPFINAVFGATSGDAAAATEPQPRIPYRIADRAVRATDDVVDTFLALIDTLRGRMTASAVLDLIGRAAIRERFGLVADDLDLVRAWIDAAGIRWGIDAAHREQSEQPALQQNTWRFGFDRLLLGYAMPGDERRLFAGVLPYDDIEGTTAELLGQLVELCETLFGFQRGLQAARTMAAWCDDLGRLLDSMLANTNQTAFRLRQIRAGLDGLAERARTAGFHDAVDLDTVQMQLAAALERNAPARGFLSGGVTFAALVPMRSIPFRVVCLLGMNDDDFPRRRRPLAFDLIALQPRPGDRSSRHDDRYLFLEALLSARERLIITYVGQSIRDNKEQQPSVVVSELLDALAESFGLPGAELHRRLVVRHPLQPFSPSYFGASTDARLFSYAQHYYQGAQAQRGARSHAPPFVNASLPSDPEARREVTVDALVRFFENPTRAFLQNRLALYLGGDLEAVQDREPIELNNLERWKIGNDLLERALREEAIDDALPVLHAAGVLPPGKLGDHVFETLSPEVRSIAMPTAQLTAAAELEPLVVDRDLDGTRITGILHQLWSSGQVRHQFSRLGGRQELGLWLRHLILNWLEAPGYPRVSLLVGRSRAKSSITTLRFGAVENAAVLLRQLLQLYWSGQSAPLLLFERASRRYGELLGRAKPATPAAALQAAQKEFDGGEHSRGDRDDAYVAQVFGAANPLDPAFRFGNGDPASAPVPFGDVARVVFRALLEHREEVP